MPDFGALSTSEWLLIALCVVLIFLPSVIPEVGDMLGRMHDRLRGRTPEWAEDLPGDEG